MNSQRSQMIGMRFRSFAPRSAPATPPRATWSATTRSTSPFAAYVAEPAIAAGMITTSTSRRISLRSTGAVSMVFEATSRCRRSSSCRMLNHGYRPRVEFSCGSGPDADFA